MTRIFDNIESSLLPALKEYLNQARSADFCVGYFNLKGWKKIEDLIENFNGGEGNCCRLLVGMEILQTKKIRPASSPKAINLLKERTIHKFQKQLTNQIPTAEDKRALQQLSAQVRAKKLIVKLYQKKLHAKLYLVHCSSIDSIAFLGSSNLTESGLSLQEELNIDVLDRGTCDLLQKWFDERWEDGLCVDISDALAEVVDENVNHVIKDAILIDQPLPPITTAVPSGDGGKNPDSQKDVFLSSDVGIDYTRLSNLLAVEEWDEADKETARVMLKVTRRQEENREEDWEAENWDEEQSSWEPEDWDNEHQFGMEIVWNHKSIEKFPCSDLRTIDQLWVKYSNGRFGFSVQKNIWQKVEQDENKFLKQVGWSEMGEDGLGEEYDLINKLTDVPSAKKLRKGYLPLRVPNSIGESGEFTFQFMYAYLFSRVAACKL